MSTSTNDSIVILGAARTPMGGFQGDFSSLSAHDLGGAAIKAAIERSGIAPEKVDEVLFAASRAVCLPAPALSPCPKCAARAWKPPCWRMTS